MNAAILLALLAGAAGEPPGAPATPPPSSAASAPARPGEQGVPPAPDAATAPAAPGTPTAAGAPAAPAAPAASTTSGDVRPGAAATSPGTQQAAQATAATAILRSAVAIEGMERLPLTPDTEAVVDPGAEFEIELSARLPDARLVLLDGRDDLVPSTSQRETSTGTRLTLAPAVPLAPGSRFTLRVDGVSERDFHDESAHAFSPLTFPILAAGTPPPPEPKRPVRRRKRR